MAEEYKPENEGSLEQFEESLIAEEKKKARKKLIAGILALVIVVLAGAYLYGNMATPPPPAPPPAPPKAAPAPPPAPEAKSEAAPAVPPPAPAKKEEPAKNGKAAAKKEEPKPVSKAAPAEKAVAKAAAPAAGEVVIQLGVFTQKVNADNLIKKVQNAGFQPETVETKVNVKRIAVYSGYYRYRETANEGSSKLTSTGFTNHVVIKGPGNYSVEVGTYNTEKEADAVVKKLELKGYKADVDYTTVKGPATMVLLKNVSASEAPAILEKLKKDGLEGFIRKK